MFFPKQIRTAITFIALSSREQLNHGSGLLKTTFGILKVFSGFAGTERERWGGEGFALSTEVDGESDDEVYVIINQCENELKKFSVKQLKISLFV